MSTQSSYKKLLFAAKLEKSRRSRTHFKRPKLRRRTSPKPCLKVEIPYGNFTQSCGTCRSQGKCKHFDKGKRQYDKFISIRFQASIKQRKSPYRSVLGYKHRGGYEKYVVRAFVHNYSKENPNKIKYFSPFDMLSERRLTKIISITNINQT